jgi:hypothetical protein
MLTVDEVHWTQAVAQELEALRVALEDHRQSRGLADASERVLRRMIDTRERLLRASRL